jgi:hypothetical protein
MRHKWTKGPWKLSGGVMVSVKAIHCEACKEPVEIGTQADDRLIVLAPELIEALEQCITEEGAVAFRNMRYATLRLNHISKTRKIIARANGKAD